METSDPILNVGTMTLDALYTTQEFYLQQSLTYKGQADLVQKEIERRTQTAVESAFLAAGKQHGTVSVALGSGFIAKADIAKTVKYDSEKLEALAKTMPYDQARAMFKIKFEVSEKLYDGIKVTNPTLARQVDDARTVTYGKPKIALVREETAAA